MENMNPNSSLLPKQPIVFLVAEYLSLAITLLIIYTHLHTSDLSEFMEKELLLVDANHLSVI